MFGKGQLTPEAQVLFDMLMSSDFEDFYAGEFNDFVSGEEEEGLKESVKEELECLGKRFKRIDENK